MRRRRDGYRSGCACKRGVFERYDVAFLYFYFGIFNCGAAVLVILRIFISRRRGSGGRRDDVAARGGGARGVGGTGESRGAHYFLVRAYYGRCLIAMSQ